jgi:hypothetical protein
MNIERLRSLRDRSLEVLRAPRVRIEVYGGPAARAEYLDFTKRHPRFKVTSNKRWGVGLLAIPDTYEEYIAGGSRRELRRRVRHAQSHGLRHAPVDAKQHLDHIVEINQSSPERQGRAMPASYLDRDAVAARVSGWDVIHGVLDEDGRLRAYATVEPLGGVWELSVLLGHADDLEHGVMFLLLNEVIQAAIRCRRETGAPSWLMYDTFWGAGKGLILFKRRFGFSPYTVDWVWTDDPPPCTPVAPTAAPEAHRRP